MLIRAADQSGSSKLNHDFDCFTIVHGSIAVGNPIEISDPIEHATWLDLPLHYVGQQFLDVCASRGGTPRNRDVVEECRLGHGNGLFLRNSHTANRAAGTRDTERRDRRLFQTNTFENRVRTESAGDLFDAIDSFLATLAHDVRRSKFFRQRDSVWMTSEQNDLLGAESLRGDDAAKSDCTVSHDCRDLARSNLRCERSMMTSSHHI